MMVGTFAKYDDDVSGYSCDMTDAWTDFTGSNVVISTDGIEFAGLGSGVIAWTDIVHKTRFYDFTGSFGSYDFSLRMFDDGLILVYLGYDNDGCGIGYFAITDDSWSCMEGN